jgi:CRP/FNR family transcriptional regulator
MVREDPTVHLTMMRVMAGRLKEAMDMIDSLSLKQVPFRLMTYFETRQKEGLVDLDLSYRELAKIIGITPEALSRTLKRMSEDGLIAVDGTTIRILDN